MGTIINNRTRENVQILREEKRSKNGHDVTIMLVYSGDFTFRPTGSSESQKTENKRGYGVIVITHAPGGDNQVKNTSDSTKLESEDLFTKFVNQMS